MAATPGTVERRTVHLSSAGAVTIVVTAMALVVGERVFLAAHRPLSWAAAAVVAAILLDPLVDRLAVRIRRVPAALLSFLVIGGFAVGIAYFAFDGLQDAISRLETAAPQAAEQIEARRDRVGEVARDFRLTERARSFADALSGRVTGGDDVLRSTAGTAPTYLVSAILTVFLMTYGPRMARAAVEQDPDDARRQRVVDVVGPAVARARSAIFLTVATGLVVGAVTAAVAGLLDLPAAVAVGFTAGLLALLPHVGIAVGSVPLVLLALGFRSAVLAVVLAVVAVALQLLDSMVVRRWVAARSVDIGLFVPWVVALVGYEVYGVGGAAYGLAFAVIGLAVLDQLHGRGALAALEAVEAALGAPSTGAGPASARAAAGRSKAAGGRAGASAGKAARSAKATGGKPAGASAGKAARSAKATGGKATRTSGGGPAKPAGKKPARASGGPSAEAAAGTRTRGSGGRPAKAASGKAADATGRERATAAKQTASSGAARRRRSATGSSA